MRQGPALSPEVDLGPVISAARRDAILDYLASAVRDGGHVLIGGSTPPGTPADGYYVAPTVVSEVDPDAKLAREEIFGPVVAVFAFGELDEAIALAERTDYGLSASIWTRDIATARRYIDSVHAGTVWVNGHVLYDSAAPFGGVRQSGFGRELGEASLDEYTQLKTVWLGD
jgi:acyl-CoA reductase-like NAD-dependent aldehyde dehydrogenase